RPQQHKLAVTRDQKIDHLLVALARLQSFTHEDAQVARERCVGIIDRLVLADHAAQLLRERAGACFQPSIRKDFVGPDRDRGRQGHQREQRDDKTKPLHISAYSAGESAALFLAGFGAPTRKRRSVSESAPPITITTAPNQISSTNGL